MILMGPGVLVTVPLCVTRQGCAGVEASQGGGESGTRRTLAVAAVSREEYEDGDWMLTSSSFEHHARGVEDDDDAHCVEHHAWTAWTEVPRCTTFYLLPREEHALLGCGLRVAAASRCRPDALLVRCWASVSWRAASGCAGVVSGHRRWLRSMLQDTRAGRPAECSHDWTRGPNRLWPAVYVCRSVSKA